MCKLGVLPSTMIMPNPWGKNRKALCVDTGIRVCHVFLCVLMQWCMPENLNTLYHRHLLCGRKCSHVLFVVINTVIVRAAHHLELHIEHSNRSYNPHSLSV